MATLSRHGRWRELRLVRGVVRRLRAALGMLGEHSRDPATRISTTRSFHPQDIALIEQTFFAHGGASGTPWEALRHANMVLPDWFRTGLDPLGEAYAEQQQRLWQAISGVERPYAPHIDEKEHDLGDIDPVRSPGFYVRRDPDAVAHAADHVIASGMLLKHSGVAPGDWALEYGAGFGQTALALARLGVHVDTVDISPTFCEYVRRQADFFQVPLTAFNGTFGTNPRPGHQYKLIWFYESFHHCLEFQNVVQQLREHLAPGGRVVLGGEPIEYRENSAVPYPWGIRLHSEVTAVVRRLHWFELGFTEDFLFDLFVSAGFVGRRVDCEPSLFGRLHIFERRPDVVDLCGLWLPTVLATEWHAAEADGRRTRSSSRLPLDASEGLLAVEFDLDNPSPGTCHVDLTYGASVQSISLITGGSVTVRFAATPGTREVRFEARRTTLKLWRRLWRLGRAHEGVLVRRVRYIATTPTA